MVGRVVDVGAAAAEAGEAEDVRAPNELAQVLVFVLSHALNSP